jgi:hypothetical protein
MAVAEPVALGVPSGERLIDRWIILNIGVMKS